VLQQQLSEACNSSSASKDWCAAVKLATAAQPQRTGVMKCSLQQQLSLKGLVCCSEACDSSSKDCCCVAWHHSSPGRKYMVAK